MRNKADRWLAAVSALAVLTEVLLRPDLRAQPPAAALGLAFAATLWFRGSHPGAATASAFGLATAATAVQLWLGQPEIGPYTAACVLLLPYSLFRFGSVRDMAIGLSAMAAAYAASLWHEMKDLPDVIGGAVVMLFPCAIGAAIRFRARAQARDLEHAKLREREQLARELHDSVAHHVTAITIQAQAARAVVASRPDAAARALAAIEDESKRTLAELRAIVGALRDDETAALVPQGRIADIASFARAETPTILVELVGELDGVAIPVEQALYRLAQESITNALKHARNARSIQIRVASEGDAVHLTAHDDGDSVGAPVRRGFGLVGMAERAALLGGEFEAGPNAGGGGWCVDAKLPRTGGAS